MTDIKRSFEKLLNATFERVDGILVERWNEAWFYRGVFYGTKETLLAAIQKDRDALAKSIKKYEK